VPLGGEGEIESISATLTQDGLAERGQAENNPLKYAAMVWN